MEKPDANGFVNVVWPSKTVPHGGIFHTRIAQPTEGQQQFLKLLLEESKFDLSQRVNDTLKLRQPDERKTARERQPSVPLIRPRTSRRRSLSEIKESGVYEFERPRPLKRGEDREKMKERLANFMAFGDSPPQLTPPVTSAAARAKPKPKLPTNKEKWNDLVTQIRERSEWLAEMEYLGQAAPHRELIQDQIAERMRALDALGIDSECSTPRSTARSVKQPGAPSVQAHTGGSRVPSGASLRSTRQSTTRESGNRQSADRQKRAPSRAQTNEENVAAYAQFSPLQYSARRRL